MKTTVQLGSMLVAVTLGCFAVSSARAVVAADPAPAVTSEPTSEFVGFWKVQDGGGRDFYITLSADGTAASTWTAAEDQRRNQTGTWKVADGKVTIAWSNGWREVIEGSAGAFVKKAYAPKMQLEDVPANTSPAVKVDALPAH